METTNSTGTTLSTNPNFSSRLAAYVALIRPPNCIMIGLAVLVGETIALGTFPRLQEAIFGFLTAFLMLAGTMAFNDIEDLEVDRVNSPTRPLPSGKVSVRGAYGLSIVLSISAMIASLVLGVWAFLTALVALLLMAYYNTRGKKMGLSGNAVVSFNVALPFFFGGLAVNNFARPLLFVFFLLAFLANMAREVAKGISDVAGDSSRGIRTVAVTSGPGVAARVSAGLFVVAVVLSFLAPVLDHTVSIYYYPGVALADLGFLYSSFRLVRDPSPKMVHKVKTQVLLWMLLGLVGFVMGGSPVV